MTDFLEYISSQPHIPVDEVAKRRESFRQVNASLALEGMIVDDAQLAQQEEIIQGRLSTEQAVAQNFAKYSELK
jgi:hypothetical protein